MRRIEIILGELERLTRGLNLADLEQETAFTAEAIGFNLGLARNSVSKDLNQLWNDGLAIKSRGRPVFLCILYRPLSYYDCPYAFLRCEWRV